MNRNILIFTILILFSALQNLSALKIKKGTSTKQKTIIPAKIVERPRKKNKNYKKSTIINRKTVTKGNKKR
ncbi:hypothetical protein GF322_01520 [Candidatus Dependentiae bacterium]|nr:hypothetical protein [Candidatus Dependentiae bacterium]